MRCGEPTVKFYVHSLFTTGPNAGELTDTLIKIGGNKTFLNNVCKKCCTDEDVAILGFKSAQAMYADWAKKVEDEDWARKIVTDDVDYTKGYNAGEPVNH